ncbi:hypothetical protein OCU04_001863 [Sclerotinia nivalis]|uniref:Uncharacterized protein n=1 Tax=Sclerotinia nivalis TaxID=352851 RepID=A0A9X0AZ05_9HELO|nr:hypothetical protein OCU04_001863 [Sclerotinia nivalis]
MTAATMPNTVGKAFRLFAALFVLLTFPPMAPAAFVPRPAWPIPVVQAAVPVTRNPCWL